MTSVAFLEASRRRRNVLGLVWTLVRTDFTTRYHGTVGGFCGHC